MPSATKRRRTSADGDNWHDDLSTVKIRVAESKTGDNPVVVAFPCGVPESAIAKSAISKPTLKFVWQQLNENSKSGRRVVGFDRDCLYSAQANGLGYDDRQTKLVVGVYHKKRNTLTLHEAASRGTVFTLQQSVPSYMEQNEQTETGKGGNEEIKPNVYEDFGSSKKRRVLKSQAANRVDIDNVVGAGDGSAMVHQMMKGQGMSESNRMAIEEDRRTDSTQKSASEKALEDARLQILPTYDEHAVKPDKVYDAKKIAGNKAWKRVFDNVFACLHKENPTDAIVESIFERDWQAFVLQFVKEVDTQADNAAYRITCAILINWMIKFYRINNKRRSIEGVDETRSTYFGMPSEVAARCFELFTTPVSNPEKSGKAHFAMTKTKNDKMITHILLMYMMSQGPSMKIPRINPIAESLGIPAGQCSTLLRYAGCRVMKVGNDASASLKTPLEFPTMGRRMPPNNKR
ncbi:A49-like RNA polymerase I associated factor [Nitzschia inconspicua]|uniref:A49-like RNA polymerase I associated factor n=1 Tax=Nitzschia inconspicua TaxID=303405 RepID=A0A9K3PY58_9STRA|nr:A49-like RNA polymerase I associated factor [Nitzschia inconspicua]